MLNQKENSLSVKILRYETFKTIDLKPTITEEFSKTRI